MNGREPALVAVGRVDLALVLHDRGERQRLAAGAGAEIDDMLARPRIDQQSRELGALVLHLDQALDEGGLGMDRRILGVGPEHDAQSERRPARRRRAQMRERGRNPLAIGLERIDAQIERRAAGERRALLRPLRAEHFGEMRVEPFRIVAGDPGRRACKRGAFERRALGRLERRRRMAGTVAQARDRLHVELALQPQHAEHQVARPLPAHEKSRRSLAAERVIDDARDGGAIAGAGETARQAPGLERVGRRPALRLDLGQDLDGCR